MLRDIGREKAVPVDQGAVGALDQEIRDNLSVASVAGIVKRSEPSLGEGGRRESGTRVWDGLTVF